MPKSRSPALVRFGARLARCGPSSPGDATWSSDEAHERLAVQVVEGVVAAGRGQVDPDNARALLPALINYYLETPQSFPTWPDAQQMLHQDTQDHLQAWLLQCLLESDSGHLEAFAVFIHHVREQGLDSSNLALRTLSSLIASSGPLDGPAMHHMLAETACFPHHIYADNDDRDAVSNST